VNTHYSCHSFYTLIWIPLFSCRKQKVSAAVSIHSMQRPSIKIVQKAGAQESFDRDRRDFSSPSNISIVNSIWILKIAYLIWRFNSLDDRYGFGDSKHPMIWWTRLADASEKVINRFMKKCVAYNVKALRRKGSYGVVSKVTKRTAGSAYICGITITNNTLQNPSRNVCPMVFTNFLNESTGSDHVWEEDLCLVFKYICCQPHLPTRTHW